MKQRLIGVVMAFALGLSTALLLVSGTTHSHAAAEADAVRPSVSTFRKRHSSTSADAWRRHGGPTDVGSGPRSWPRDGGR